MPRSTVVTLVLMLGSMAATSNAAPPGDAALDRRFEELVRPFVKNYCLACHGADKPKGKLNLSLYSKASDVIKHTRAWDAVRERLESEEMPPEDAPRQPGAHERGAVVAWIDRLREREARRNAGDPGPVPARRLSNAELDYTIRDLTGVDIRPGREFPVDAANEAGFDNSSESLVMSPALLGKYLEAARRVADHLVLKPHGFDFAPHPVVTDTDRDKYCVARIIDFYRRHQVDYADYFLAAWRFQNRAALGRPDARLLDLAAEAGLSARYLTSVWAVLAQPAPEPGPLSEVVALWRKLPADARAADEARRGCVQMRDLVIRLRKAFEPDVGKVQAAGISPGSQPLILWRNRRLASMRMRYTGEGKRPDLKEFCRIFPDGFFVSDRPPYFEPKAGPSGRLLTAGFHLMQGYFRDDAPLYELVLDDTGRRALDGLWQELDFVTLAPMRQYKDFIFFERAEPPRYMFGAEFDFARSEDKDAISEAKIRRLSAAYLAKARRIGAKEEALRAIEAYFTDISAKIRGVERARLAAEPSHLEALKAFAARAYRRPLAPSEQEELLAFYRRLREKDHLRHEDALRDTVASVLVSPQFCYRLDPAEPGPAAAPLANCALASRLSYFLWSSMPDQELLDHAAAGDLHDPAVLVAQVRRMVQDSRIRGLAVEFGGNWLGFRRFEEHKGVDRERFPSFTSELREAMYEEVVRFFMDLLKNRRSVLDLLYADHTFVNLVLARHYGMAVPGGTAFQALDLQGQNAHATRGTAFQAVDLHGQDARGTLRRDGGPDEWVRIDDAGQYGRGGILPMAVFLTASSPGLRTSPVKRGHWVIRRVLGEQIPAPPPNVPELPKDEAALGALTLPQLLARHRQDKSCAACHQRFDSVGLALEGYGPIGERRDRDLGGHQVDARAVFPDGGEGTGLDGLRRYLSQRRQDEFVENLTRKLFAYALGRGLLSSDDPTIRSIRGRLAASGYRIDALIESIVTTPQFLKKRGRDDERER
jgi:hypothetical protein